MLRAFCSALGDGYQPLVFVSLSSRNAGFACRTSGGNSGQTGGPPALSVSRPDTASIASRSCSALSRRGAERSSSANPETFAGFAAAFATSVDLCRYVALVTIVRCNFFNDHPFRTNSDASQSSNSGCVGRAPARPKSFGVATNPLPKHSCHTRFTITRAVKGLSGDAIHSASASRRPLVRRLGAGGTTAGFGSKADGKPGATSSFSCFKSPWNKIRVTGTLPSLSEASKPRV